MGSNHTKQNVDRRTKRQRSNFRKMFCFQIKQRSNSQKPLSNAGINEFYYYEHQPDETSLRPLPLVDIDDFSPIEIDLENTSLTLPSTRLSNQIEQYNENDNYFGRTTTISYDQQISEHDDQQAIINNSKYLQIYKSLKHNEYDWKCYLPLTLEKFHTQSILKDLIYKCVNDNKEFKSILNRFSNMERSDENEEFLDWFFNEVEYFMYSYDENKDYEHKCLLVRSIEQDRYDCMRYIFEHQLLTSKLDINMVNDQGRHSLLMLAHKNGPFDAMKYILDYHLSCLDTNKLDLNNFSSLHHSCRHFNLLTSDLLLEYTGKKTLNIENSELHTPLDYWIECLCSLKKLKPTYNQNLIDTQRLDYLLNDTDYYSHTLFFQKMIDYGGQLTKIPLRYMRSVLSQLTFGEKLSYVDHHITLSCTLYKNRLSTLIIDYDHLKTSIQAGEILTEFIYALGTIQLEVQNRLAIHNYSNVSNNVLQRIYNETNENHSNNQMELIDFDNLQLIMRTLYFKFFRLFQCIYNNPDIDIKCFQFEHVFRRVWIYWKEPVQAFIAQCKEKNSSLKSICRTLVFKRLNRYPTDIQSLPLHIELKQYLAYDNQFFIVKRRH